MYKTILTGNIGKDCVVNTVNGKNVINFPTCTTEVWKDAQGNKQEKSRWFDCALWRDNTAIAQYLKKGTRVLLEGQVDVKQFQRQDGTQGVGMTFRVSNVELLGGGNREPEQQQSTGQVSNEASAGEPIDDLPF